MVMGSARRWDDDRWDGDRSGAGRTANADDTVDWVVAHTELSRLARERAVADAEEGRWLLRALRSAAHVHVGAGSFAEYVERPFGYKPRTTQEKLRVAEALEGLPCIARELERGTLGWCAARELTRVAVTDTESEWLEVARGKTVRQLERLVGERSPGATPSAPPEHRPQPRLLRFQVQPETFALVREAMDRLRRAAGEPWDDDTVLLAMARHVLGGPVDDERSSYQVSLAICARCGSGEQIAGGQPIAVSAAVVDMAACDAQHIGHLLPKAVHGDDAHEPGAPEAANQNAASAHAPGDDAHVDANEDGAQRVANEQGAADVHAAANQNAASPSASASVHEHDAHVGARFARDSAASLPSNPSIARATQSIPPALRRAVLARDQHRCQVPGCTHSRFVDVHHVVPRAEGGRHVATNLITLCSAHHRATHRGNLGIERRSDGGLGFRHADGTPYGEAIQPRAVDVHAKVFSALRHLGFREGEVRAVFEELLADEALQGSNPEQLLREALCRIRGPRS